MIALDDFDQETSLVDIHIAEVNLKVFGFLRIYREMVRYMDDQARWIQGYHPHTDQDRMDALALKEAIHTWQEALRETRLQYDHEWTAAA